LDRHGQLARPRTLTAAAGVKPATPGVRSSVLKWRRGRDCRADHRNLTKSGISRKPDEPVCTSLVSRSRTISLHPRRAKKAVRISGDLQSPPRDRLVAVSICLALHPRLSVHLTRSRVGMGNDATKRRAIPRQFPRPLPLRRQRLRGIDPADRTGQASGRAASSVKIKRRTTMPLIEVHLIENVFDSRKSRSSRNSPTPWLASKARTCAA
jgi:hypothetical protein